MDRELQEEIEAFRARFRQDVRDGSVRSRADYRRDFPRCDAEVATALASYERAMDSARRTFIVEGAASETGASRGAGPAGEIGETGHGMREGVRRGRYELLQELGRGGQGAVYLARDVELGREVALKVLNAGGAITAEARLRFKGEAEKAAKLDHPNIARVHEWGEEDGVPYIAMEFVRGKTLAAHIRDSARAAERGTGGVGSAEGSGDGSTWFAIDDSAVSLDADSGETGGGGPESSRNAASAVEAPPSSSAVDRRAMLEIARLVESAARGLHEAHERGLVHRDIKPGNLVVTEDRGLVILDFGLARDETSEAPALTMTGDVMGTPAYMSPEQLSGGRVRVDRRSDVFSLGVTLFECLALRRPFEAPTLQGIFQAIIEQEAPDLRRVNRKVPADLAVITSHALAKQPEQRYQTALDLAEDLRRFRELEPIAARPIGPLVRTWRWARRKPATAALLATVFVALTAIAGLTTLKNRELGRLNTDLERTTRTAEANADAARRNAEAARENERRATEEARAKAAALSEYERMADTRRLANARAEADECWPEHPDLVPRLEAWQQKYAPLCDRLEDHRIALEALRREAGAYADADRRRDFEAEFARIAALESELPGARELAGAQEDAARRESMLAAVAKAENELAELRRAVEGRRSWDFGDDVDRQFRHDTLTTLVKDLAAFTHPESGVTASIARRLDRSRRIAKETLEDRAALWNAAIARVAANPRYAGLVLTPELGLIPLGPDPGSGLEEFLDWRTHDGNEAEGTLPRRDEDGRIAMTASRGLVFVLIPGGSFRMGSQRNPEQPNFEADAEPDEAPVHELTLRPFFLSKYEMTQGQWSRLDGANPSRYGPGWFNSQVLEKPVDLAHPVEMMNWHEATRRLAELDLVLPTEAQWERAARADADPPSRWAGTSDIAELSRFANVSGREAREYFDSFSPQNEDDFVIHAPVGSFAPNGFGLFDVSGNLAEWCRDGYASYEVASRPEDGFRDVPSSGFRVVRGGSFRYNAPSQRLAFRNRPQITFRNHDLGVRPARTLARG